MKMKEALSEILKNGGAKNMFKGVGPLLVRGYISNAVNLPTFDYFMHKMNALI